MKKIMLILTIGIIILSGCAKKGLFLTEKNDLIFIDSSGFVENINNPGVMVAIKDTIIITKTVYYGCRKSDKYKITSIKHQK